MKWRKYSDLEPHRRLRNEGRELLCKEILMTEKRDGENVSNKPKMSEAGIYFRQSSKHGFYLKDNIVLGDNVVFIYKKGVLWVLK